LFYLFYFIPLKDKRSGKNYEKKLDTVKGQVIEEGWKGRRSESFPGTQCTPF
jgi:hypothetical protein